MQHYIVCLVNLGFLVLYFFYLCWLCESISFYKFILIFLNCIFILFTFIWQFLKTWYIFIDTISMLCTLPFFYVFTQFLLAFNKLNYFFFNLLLFNLELLSLLIFKCEIFQFFLQSYVVINCLILSLVIFLDFRHIFFILTYQWLIRNK